MNLPPVRRIVTRSGRRIRGKFPSRKMGGMVEWESPHEAAAIRLFEFNPGVRAYYSQPSVEHYHDAFGNAHSFIPDFRVDWRHGGSLLVEVKSEADAVYPPTQHLLGLKAMAMQLQGKPYRVLTPAQMKSQPLLENLELLECHARGTLPAEILQRIDALPKSSAFPVERIAHHLGGTPAVFRAVAHGLLHADLQQLLNTESLIWHPNHMEAGDGTFPI